MRRRDEAEQQAATENGGQSTSASSQQKTPEPVVPEPPKYTALQVKNCKEIIAKTNYYQILNLPQDCKEEDIKKAYKKFAIKFHPDKNRAPQASEAFKKVSSAYVCLSDKDKRAYYDKTGREPGNNQSPSPSGGDRRHHGSHFEQDINPEEIFNMFFGGGLFQQPSQRRQ